MARYDLRCVMWIYLLIGIVLIFILYKERQALGCPTIPDGSDCNNAQGKAVVGTEPSPNDSTNQVLSKIDGAATFSDRDVVWRRAILVAATSIVVLWFVLYRTIPSEYEWLVGILVVSGLIYFCTNFYKFHLVNYAENNVRRGTDILRERYGQGV